MLKRVDQPARLPCAIRERALHGLQGVRESAVMQSVAGR